jgi:hypothetical protein
MIGWSGKPLGVGLSPVWPGPGTKGDVLGMTTADDEDADELLGGAEDVLSGADELLGGTDVELSGADELLGGTDALVGGTFDELDGADELVLGGIDELVDGGLGADDVGVGVGVEEGQDTQNTLCLAAPFSPVNFQKSL